MNCSHCSEEIPLRANFCPKCKTQIKCLHCFEILEPESSICIVCGEDTKLKLNQYNTVEFHETKKTRTFKAIFSNEVGQSIGEALGLVIANKKVSPVNNRQLPPNNSDGEISEESSQPIEDTEFIEVQKNNPQSTSRDRVFDLFNDSDGNLTIHETRLKATSKRDYGIRLAILFLYYKLQKGANKVNRSELTKIMNDASLNDGNFRYWLTNTNLIGVHDDLVELKAPGRDKAKEIIGEVYDDSKEDKWKLGSPTKKRKKRESGENVEE